MQHCHREAAAVTSHRQWTPTEMPRMRQAMVEHYQGTLDRMAQPGVRDFLRRERVGKLHRVSKTPVTAAKFDAELAAEMQGTQREVEHYRGSELFWVTRDMTRVAMDASSDIPAWVPETTVPAPTGLLVWAEPLPRLCWYGVDHSPFVTADAVQWVSGDGYVDIDILSRTDQLVAEGHLDRTGRRGPFVKVRGVVLRAEEPTPVDQYVAAAEPGLIAALGATWTLMQIPTVATPRQITGAGGSGRQWQNQPRTVSIIDLRRLEHRDTAATDSAGRAYRHRWYVRGHWREQPHGPRNRCADPPGYPATSRAHPGRPCSSSSGSPLAPLRPPARPPPQGAVNPVQRRWSVSDVRRRPGTTAMSLSSALVRCNWRIRDRAAAGHSPNCLAPGHLLKAASGPVSNDASAAQLSS